MGVWFLCITYAKRARFCFRLVCTEILVSSDMKSSGNDIKNPLKTMLYILFSQENQALARFLRRGRVGHAGYPRTHVHRNTQIRKMNCKPLQSSDHLPLHYICTETMLHYNKT